MLLWQSILFIRKKTLNSNNKTFNTFQRASIFKIFLLLLLLLFKSGEVRRIIGQPQQQHQQMAHNILNVGVVVVASACLLSAHAKHDSQCERYVCTMVVIGIWTKNK